MLAICYAILALSLLADWITTQAGIKRGAKESGPVKTAWGRALVGAAILGAMWVSCFGPDGWRWSAGANIALCLGIAATRFYAAYHNNKVAR